MNGFGGLPSAAVAPTPTLLPTASGSSSSSSSFNSNSTPNPAPNHAPVGAAVAPSPFAPATASLKQQPLVNAPNVFPYAGHDTTSITGKRKRADSSPVKEPQNVSLLPAAQKLQLLADFRKGFLNKLLTHDAGISLLDKPISREINAHEAKKSKTLTNPDGLQTLRQRLSSDTYTSLRKLRMDIDCVVAEALEALGAAPGIAPEDEMKDDDAAPINGNAAEVAEKTAKIRSFGQLAGNMITDAVKQYADLDRVEDQDTPEADSEGPSDEADEQEPPYKLAVSLKVNNKTYYSSLLSPKAKTKKPNADDMDIDDGPDEGYISSYGISAVDLPPGAELVKIYEADSSMARDVKIKDVVPQHNKTSQNRHEKRESERRTRDSGLQTAHWIDNGPFGSFLPSSDNGYSIVPEGQKSWYWYSQYGEQELARVRSGVRSDEEEEKAFKELVDNYEQMPIDPALFESETDDQKTLREINDLLCKLHLQQNTRLAKHNHPTQPSKPDQAETKTYEEVLDRLAKLIAQLDPGVCDRLDKLIADLNPGTSNIPLTSFAMPGSMQNPEKAPQPQAPMPTPAPNFTTTTTRVSYAPPYSGDGTFTPNARIVSSRSSGHNQYTNRSTFSHQQYPQPQTPVRQQYPPNSSYFPNQAPYTGHHRQSIPATPQYSATGYTNSPFSRSNTTTVPRMAAASGQQVYVHGSSTPTFQAPAIRQTNFITQQTSHGPVQVQTGRRVSLAPQVAQPQPQQHRPPSAQGFAAPYTPGHAQYTGIAQQTQQQMLRNQQQPQQFHGPQTPTPAQFAMFQQQQQQHVRAIQPGQTRVAFPNGYNPGNVRIVQGPPGTPGTPGQPTSR
ncbi:hypothetical protein H072_3596 [Dactylellina haptotyla CBS 200.50]|uniref:DUF7877 domain-containing protein n=1 Tax=Dactylellina haptotyla (strain CBS 200.50) TaxID=1284197 RepID=S8C419_DACHA|nr:hypothetical protein H072_3596 [Dactylellina haptotyla CBS 200.50]